MAIVSLHPFRVGTGAAESVEAAALSWGKANCAVKVKLNVWMAVFFVSCTDSLISI
jgi:hypothetical protein